MGLDYRLIMVYTDPVSSHPIPYLPKHCNLAHLCSLHSCLRFYCSMSVFSIPFSLILSCLFLSFLFYLLRLSTWNCLVLFSEMAEICLPQILGNAARRHLAFTISGLRRTVGWMVKTVISRFVMFGNDSMQDCFPWIFLSVLPALTLLYWFRKKYLPLINASNLWIVKWPSLKVHLSSFRRMQL